MKVLGTFHSAVETKDKIVSVIEGQGNASLLSYKTASMLGLIKVDIVAGNVNIDRSQDPLTLEKLAAEHPELFENVGKLKNHEVNLHIDESVKPVAQPHRRIPFHLRKKVEDELQSLLDQDIIEPATGATPWVSPIVTPPKPKEPDKVRLCADMRQANQAIIRERHVMPTLGTTQKNINRLQRVQNTLARSVASHALPRGTRSFDILQDLHWLPIDQRIEFKLATLTYNILNSSRPAYLHVCSLLNYHTFTSVLPTQSSVGSACPHNLCLPRF